MILRFGMLIFLSSVLASVTPAFARLGSEPGDCGDVLTEPGGFTIRVGDVALDPSERKIRHGEKIAQLSPSTYTLFEAVLMGEGAIVTLTEISEAARQGSARKSSEDGLYGHNWIAQNYVRLRSKLIAEFGDQFGQRLVRFFGRGLAWNTSGLIAASQNFPQGQITYLSRLGRTYIGADEIRGEHPKRDWILRQAILAGRKGINFGWIADEWRADFNEDFSAAIFAGIISRVNTTLKNGGYRGPERFIRAQTYGGQLTYIVDPTGLKIIDEIY